LRLRLPLNGYFLRINSSRLTINGRLTLHLPLQVTINRFQETLHICITGLDADQLFEQLFRTAKFPFIAGTQGIRHEPDFLARLGLRLDSDRREDGESERYQSKDGA
jgi:hypothetical protein